MSQPLSLEQETLRYADVDAGRSRRLSLFARFFAALLDVLRRLGLVSPRLVLLPEVPELEPDQVAARLPPASRLLLAELEGRSTPAGQHALQAVARLQLAELKQLSDQGGEDDGYRGAALFGLVSRSPVGQGATMDRARAFLETIWRAPVALDVARLRARRQPTADQAMESLLLADELAAALHAVHQARGYKDALVWKMLARRIDDLRQSFYRCRSSWIDRAELAREILAYCPPAAGDLSAPLWRELAALDRLGHAELCERRGAALQHAQGGR